MYLKVSRPFRVFMILLSIVLAVIYAYRNVPIPMGSPSAATTPESEKEYKHAHNHVKVYISYFTDDINMTNNTIDDLIKKGVFSRIVKNDRSGNSRLMHSVFLAEYPDSLSNLVVTSFQKIKSNGNQKDFKQESIPNVEYQKNLSEKLRINNALKDRYLTDLTSKRGSVYYTRLQESLTETQTEIDSILTEMQTETHYQTHQIILVAASQAQSRIKMLPLFLKEFIIGVLITTIGLVVIFFVFEGILRILSYLGIRTKGGSGSSKYGYGGKGSYGGYSSYGGYGGYSSNRRKRKTVKIYKTKDGEKRVEEDK